MIEEDLITQYQKIKPQLSLKQRYFDIFELRHGLKDGVKHTFKECGEKFGISGTRARQLDARVQYKIQKIIDGRSII